MAKQFRKITVTVDNRQLQVDPGITILEAAEHNDIYIPTLCSHKDLTPYGGCRMCLVEVEGLRGLPTACTTPVEPDMIVRTRTAQIQQERKEVLQLILSEHTSSCLICTEKEECRKYLNTIRKAGVTTGCRYCSRDGTCELQEVCDYLELDEIGFPIFYRNLPVEREDPFYDRDYNICILCGRCIRVCQEVRSASVLAFKQRGRHTVVGPAFERTHLEAGCEFCGACVEVCPTGALAEKVAKWEGTAEREVESSCSLCGVGCQIRLQVSGERVISTLPADDPLVNRGQLCVKGRFALPELVHHYDRLMVPWRRKSGNPLEISLDEAVAIAARRIKAGRERMGIIVSSNCTNEDFYVAQKFARVVTGTHHIDTTSRVFYGSGFNAYTGLLAGGKPLSTVRDADTILCIGLDARYGRSVVGVELRRAHRRGAGLITLHPRPHSLGVLADPWMQPETGQELTLLRRLVRLTGGKQAVGGKKVAGAEPLKVARQLSSARKPLILLGSEFYHYDNSEAIHKAVGKLADNVGAGIVALPPQSNLAGSLLMGSYPELLPGGKQVTNRLARSTFAREWGVDLPATAGRWNSYRLLKKHKLDLLYLIGEIPTEERPAADFLIYQHNYPPPQELAADLVFPTAACTEVMGSIVNGEGRLQSLRQAVSPPGKALPDWQILCLIAGKMGVAGFDFKDHTDIQTEIAALTGIEYFTNPSRQLLTIGGVGNFSQPVRNRRQKSGTGTDFPLTLTISFAEHTHRGFLLAQWVAGAERIFQEETVLIGPEDAGRHKLKTGDRVKVTGSGISGSWPVTVLPEIARSYLRLCLTHPRILEQNPQPVKIRKQ